jgi:GNAT superfamily N-acetyltransferase
MTQRLRAQPPEVRLEFEDLDTRHIDELAELCGGCVYWEFPRAFDERVGADKARLMKAKWICCNTAEFPVGRVALSAGRLTGFVQFGPPELYPRRLEYDSGPVGDDALFIACLFVDPDDRRKGIARRLLAEATEVGRGIGYAALETFARRGSANNPSGPLGLYEACGFAVVRDAPEFPLVRREIGGEA